ncbi:YbaN family protein [Candidatus Bathyarchaeota archaeon]|nr:YbaN family protein [Candidatus Bathyarchaeota archaeon]
MRDNRRRRLKRGLYFLLGTIFLVLGGVGIILPILPTTPFLLLSLACYYQSSKRMHNWMLHNKWFGSYLRNYTEGKGISLKAKLFTISLLWILICYSVFFVVNIMIVQILLFVIAIGVSIHLIELPTFGKK